MSTPESKSDDSTALESRDSEPMRSWERWCAGFSGIALSGTGGVATFLSVSQAPTVMLILAGLALLLIAIQGTSLIRIGGSSANLELERRRLNKAVRKATEDPDPDTAYAAFDAIETIAPGATGTAQAIHYEKRLLDEIRNLSDRVEVEYRVNKDLRADARIQGDLGATLIEVEFRNRPLTVADIQKVLMQYPTDDSYGLVIVTNSPLSAAVKKLNANNPISPPEFEVVTWLDSSDNDILVRAISRMMG